MKVIVPLVLSLVLLALVAGAPVSAQTDAAEPPLSADRAVLTAANIDRIEPLTTLHLDRLNPAVEHFWLQAAFSDDSRYLAASARTGDRDRNLYVWDLTSGTQILNTGYQVHGGATLLQFTPDNLALITGALSDDASRGPNAVYLWDLASGRSVRWEVTFPVGDLCDASFRSNITGLTFNENGTLLAYEQCGAGVVAWVLRTGVVAHQFANARWLGSSSATAYALDRDSIYTIGTGETMVAAPQLSRYGFMPHSLVVAPNFSRYVGRYNDATPTATLATIFDLPTGAALYDIGRWGMGYPTSYTFSRDGTVLAILFSPTRDEEVPHIALLEAASGMSLATLDFDRGPTRTQFSPDGRLLLVAFGDGRLVLYGVQAE